MKNKGIIFEFIGWMIFLWVIWFYTGGPERIESIDQPFIKPIAPLNTGDDFGVLPDLSGFSIFSPRKDVLIDNIGSDDMGEEHYGGQANIYFAVDERGREFVEINASSLNKNPLNITGWSIKTLNNNFSRFVGTGSELILQGKVSEEKEILLYPGEKAFLIPGGSPVGISFKLNKCIGYFEQFQDFYPELPKFCPHPGFDEYSVSGGDKYCDAFLKSIPRCNAYVKEFPAEMSYACKVIINSRLNYNSCISESSGDKDFKKGEWRVYVEGDEFFSKGRNDIISIYDQKGRLIETLFYNN